MGRILGACLATLAAATVTIPAFRAESSDYYNELESDRQAAATAEIFIENIPEFRDGISQAIVSLEAKYDADFENIPNECRLIVLEEEPESIDDINVSSKCSYDKDQISDARRILMGTQVEIEQLRGYLEGTGYYGLDEDIESAKSIINDANDTSLFNDLTDIGYVGTISREIKEDGTFEITSYDSGRRLDILEVAVYTLLAFAATGAALAIGNSVGKRNTNNQLSRGPAEPDILS